MENTKMRPSEEDNWEEMKMPFSVFRKIKNLVLLSEFRENNSTFCKNAQFFEPSRAFAPVLHIVCQKSAKIAFQQKVFTYMIPLCYHVADKLCLFVINLKKSQHLFIFVHFSKHFLRKMRSWFSRTLSHIWFSRIFSRKYSRCRLILL